MIASFRHNFIFIKTRKTAGTSIEMALSQSCGPDDVVAPIMLTDELARGIRLQNASPALDGDLREAAARHDNARYNRLLLQLKNNAGFSSHMPAVAIRERLPETFWRSAFKFTIERHPYEKAVSCAYFLLRHRPADKFADVLDMTIHRRLFDDFGLYTIDGQVVVDRIIRYEHLPADLSEVFSAIGIQLPPLPNSKREFRRDHRPAAEILSATQKARIFEMAKSTFALMGYEP